MPVKGTLTDNHRARLGVVGRRRSRKFEAEGTADVTE
jgi:hypothetical protein